MCGTSSNIEQMKKIISLVMLAALMGTILAGCSGGGDAAADSTTGEATPAGETAGAAGGTEAAKPEGTNAPGQADMQPGPNANIEMGNKTGGN